MQYLVIQAVPLHLTHFNSLRCFLLVWPKKKKEIDDLPSLLPCQSGILAMFSSDVNSPIIALENDLNNNLEQRIRAENLSRSFAHLYCGGHFISRPPYKWNTTALI